MESEARNFIFYHHTCSSEDNILTSTTQPSEIKPCLPCGVVQGSKLLGLLYTIYANEVPILQNILTNQEVCNTVGAKLYYELPVDHSVVNFVDDSNSVITADQGSDIEKCTNGYLKFTKTARNSK